MDTYISTVSGRIFDYELPSEDMVSPIDIAWALSGINRFTGHTNPYYSVAQHSTRVSYMVPTTKALAAFGHDFAEAYIGDINTPLKTIINNRTNGWFKQFEQKVENLVWKVCGIPSPHGDAEIKAADYADFEIARDCLMGQDSPIRNIVPQSPKEAFKSFIARWIELDPSMEHRLAYDAARLLRSH